ncbi:MAG: hypothetical protein IPK14_25210 [Blastocatellia bacterium]|nr:hypothetical protein [Blastocatellia bacterium]
MFKFNNKVVVTLIVGLYFFWCLLFPYQWRLLDGVNVLIHEAGHPLFGILGEFMSILGGTLMQLIMPILFVGYFFWNNQKFSGAIVLFWVGHNLLNISIYSADAVVMQLPLIGNGDRLHDWNYMLSELNLLGQTNKIALMIRISAIMTIIVAFVLSLIFSQSDEEIVPTNLD